MLGTMHATGRPVHLIAYPHGAGGVPSFPVERLWPLPPVRSLRSGPSAGKVLLDTQLTLRLPRWLRTLRPVHVVAHHVEAAAAVALGSGNRPFAFFAHTALGPELPYYLPGVPTAWLRRAGDRLDRWLLRRAHRRMAVSPLLARRLETLGGREVHVVPVPWPLPPPIRATARTAARRALGIEPDERVVLYAGNLDAYQGWETLLEMLGRLLERHRSTRLLVATASEPTPLTRAARRAGLRHRLLLAPLHGETDRRRAHAAADCVVVPRRAPGGLPVKLLDAMARGLPVVAAETALAGFPLLDAVALVRDHTAQAFAAAVHALFDSPRDAEALAARSRATIRRLFSRRRFLDAMDAALSSS